MVASLVDLETGREWLDQPTGGSARTAKLDDAYGGPEACGWDECFPTVNAAAYPEPPWLGAPLADHGELWSRPWTAERDGAALVTRINGARLPYRFERRLSLEGRSVLAEYEVANMSESPLLGLWAMHPLLRAQSGMRVLLPSEVASVACTYSSGAFVAAVSEIAWPTRAGRDLSLLAPPEEGLALKLFTGRLDAGRAALAGADGWLGVEWSPDELPYLGLWLNQAGWPSHGPARYHVAFEPTRARADDLPEGARRGEAIRLDPGGVARWSVRIVLGTALEDAAAFVRG